MTPDLTELIAHDHRVVAGLVEGLQDAGRADRFPLAHRLLDELATHMAAELQILFPALRDIVPGGVELANRGQSDHDTLRPILVALSRRTPTTTASTTSFEVWPPPSRVTPLRSRTSSSPPSKP